jgi:hypothetical protein
MPRKVHASSQKILTANQIIESIPPLPEYTPFKHQKDIHQSIVSLPQGFDSSDEYALFSLFFLEESYSIIATATNEYYRIHGQYEDCDDIGRHWTEATPQEIKTIVAITIYIGLYPTVPIKEFWKTQPMRTAIHVVIYHMKLHRFEQLRRFFHISPPSEEDKGFYSSNPP